MSSNTRCSLIAVRQAAETPVTDADILNYALTLGKPLLEPELYLLELISC